jgi:hypothetical protein
VIGGERGSSGSSTPRPDGTGSIVNTASGASFRGGGVGVVSVTINGFALAGSGMCGARPLSDKALRELP